MGITRDGGRTDSRIAPTGEQLIRARNRAEREIERYENDHDLDRDADGSAEATHDVTADGLHIDVYRDGEEVDTHELTPPKPANEALGIAEEHLAEHLVGYVRRFERWHGIKLNGR